MRTLSSGIHLYKTNEQMVRCYGRNCLKQFVKGKPICFGFKQWLLCRDSGHCFHMEVYQGKDMQQPTKRENELLGSRVINMNQLDVLTDHNL